MRLGMTLCLAGGVGWPGERGRAANDDTSLVFAYLREQLCVSSRLALPSGKLRNAFLAQQPGGFMRSQSKWTPKLAWKKEAANRRDSHDQARKWNARGIPGLMFLFLVVIPNNFSCHPRRHFAFPTQIITNYHHVRESQNFGISFIYFLRIKYWRRVLLSYYNN